MMLILQGSIGYASSKIKSIMSWPTGFLRFFFRFNSFGLLVFSTLLLFFSEFRSDVAPPITFFQITKELVLIISLDFINNSITCKFDAEVGLDWILETHDAEEITILGESRAPKHIGDVTVKIVSC